MFSGIFQKTEDRLLIGFQGILVRFFGDLNRGQRPDVLALDVNDAAMGLNLAFGNNSRGCDRHGTTRFEEFGTDDQVDKAPFIFQGNKENSLRRHRALPNRDKARNFYFLPVILVGQLG